METNGVETIDVEIDFARDEASMSMDETPNVLPEQPSVGGDIHHQFFETPISGETPIVGMQFSTHELARVFYKTYGKKKGFSTRIRTSAKTKRGSNEVTAYKYVCTHEGTYNPKDMDGASKRSRNTSTVRGDCKACMWIVKDFESNTWNVTQFSEEHNHEFVTPRKNKLMPCNREMPDAAKSLVDIFNRENLQINKVASVLTGDVIGFNQRDCWNYLRSVRQSNLGMGDAQTVLAYFQKRQLQNPQFYYAIQCDMEGRAVNFFWVDAPSRMAYKHFGDVVTFDTTYRTNKYNMPFAPFTGVNHHFQTIQFGCALLQDETETTFIWLFQTWLEAMGGSPPVSIITDQDLAMKSAIAKVLPLPKTRHRLCIWHIMKKFGEKLSHVYSDGSMFKGRLNQCIWGTYDSKHFEDQWTSLMTEYGLQNNDWLKHLYEIRESWIPVYNRATFFAGMNTTGRSEGANAFFDGSSREGFQQGRGRGGPGRGRGGPGRGRGRGRGRKQPVEKSANDLDKELETYHAEAMNTS